MAKLRFCCQVQFGDFWTYDFRIPHKQFACSYKELPFVKFTP